MVHTIMKGRRELSDQSGRGAYCAEYFLSASAAKAGDLIWIFGTYGLAQPMLENGNLYKADQLPTSKQPPLPPLKTCTSLSIQWSDQLCTANVQVWTTCNLLNWSSLQV